MTDPQFQQFVGTALNDIYQEIIALRKEVKALKEASPKKEDALRIEQKLDKIVKHLKVPTWL